MGGLLKRVISSFGIWTFNVNDWLIKSGRFSCGGLRCDSCLLHSSAGLSPASTAQANVSQPVSSCGSTVSLGSRKPFCLVGRAGGALQSETTRARNSQAHNHLHLLTVIRGRKKKKSRGKKIQTQTEPGMLPLTVGFPTSFQAVFQYH